MIDLLFVVEIAWCTVWLGTRTRWRALLYTAGAVTACAIGLFTSTWLTGVLAPPASPVFLWVSGQVQNSAQAVGYLHAFLPPEAAVAVNVANQHQWVAYSILRTAILLLIAFAIFWVFMLVVWLIDALWDVQKADETSFRVESTVAGLFTGVLISTLTGYGLVHAAWLKALSDLSGAGLHSYGILAIKTAVEWVRIHQPNLYL